MKAKTASILEIHPLVLAVLIFFAIAIPYSALNQPSGPVGEVVGTIETSGAVGKGSVITSVRLQDGTLVQAKMTTNATPRSGQVAYMRTYHRLISKEKTYEIYRTYNAN
jgi:hypothetical protein